MGEYVESAIQAITAMLIAGFLSVVIGVVVGFVSTYYVDSTTSIIYGLVTVFVLFIILSILFVFRLGK